MLRRGKARADDRLRDISSGTPFLIVDVIPEDAELMTTPFSDVRLIIRDEEGQITWECKTSVHGMAMSSGNAGLTLGLVPAHPQIGEKILLETGHDVPVLVTVDGKTNSPPTRSCPNSLIWLLGRGVLKHWNRP